MSDVEVVKGAQVTLEFEGKRCIHARQCVLTRPDVFVPNVQGEWIHPDAARPEEIAALAHGCPSGAIRYQRHDGGPEEAAPVVNMATVRENGPVAIRGPLTIDGQPAGFRATMCRCGASNNKPFCDGSHTKAGFAASGEPATRPSEPLAQRGGPLEVVGLPNGPLQVKGNLEVVSGTGRTIERKELTYFCRCGASNNKPYCDGTHRAIGFKTT